MKSKLIDNIVMNLTDDLLKPQYRKMEGRNKYTGHCYVASECYYYMSGEKLSVYHIKHEGSTHWYLKDEYDGVIDLTYLQFKTPVPYENGRRGFFLTNKPSKRTQTLINKINN